MDNFREPICIQPIYESNDFDDLDIISEGIEIPKSRAEQLNEELNKPNPDFARIAEINESEGILSRTPRLGKMFHTGSVELVKCLFDTNPDTLKSVRFLDPLNQARQTLSLYDKNTFMEAIGITEENWQDIKDNSKGLIAVTVGNTAQNHQCALVVDMRESETFQDFMKNPKFHLINTKPKYTDICLNDGTELHNVFDKTEQGIMKCVDTTNSYVIGLVNEITENRVQNIRFNKEEGIGFIQRGDRIRLQAIPDSVGCCNLI